ncbi:HD-GYP domain-containing protein [Uliginosibacterium sp. 31-12]|uniref:HD-GYP domain-containing protein n=1 Tax=Uliginosibacterium sp. 31-12 TaxID=3062781 RepID=UPI0026E3C098|nr:HD domain-containing phosphohydrolase [Uliginosibacterium sp. 31-12]MDO6386008.1 response regulator [Uliginosibacterium sp. 31-12]
MNIAIVEDTPVNLVVMQSLIKRLGDHDCLVFSDPELGLAWCLDNAPDLIIVDYMMPRLDGLEFVRRCRATPALRDRPILMVTAAAEKEVRYAALEAGATDFLTKPIDRNEFNPRVRNMLQLRASMAATSLRADELSIAVRRATEEIHLRERETVMRLARAAEFRDPETGSHILRMAHYSAIIGYQLGMSEEFVDQLLSAAPMHDVGKLGTPDHILLKPGKLSPKEMEIMRQHALIGYEILKNSSSPVLQMAAEIALNHHEKYDGSGYPQGKAGEEIPIVGRIVAVADVFDALTSERPYKPAWDLEHARAHLEAGRGNHFDPRCVDLFLASWNEIIEIHNIYQD